MPNAVRFSVPILVLAAAAIVLDTGARADVLTFNLSKTPTAKGDTSTGLYNPLSIYTEPGGFGVAFLIPPVPVPLPRGGGGNNSVFMTGLTKSFTTNGGWSFGAAANDLAQNSLVVNADQVAGGKKLSLFFSAGRLCRYFRHRHHGGLRCELYRRRY
jgi:hypothetical protein